MSSLESTKPLNTVFSPTKEKVFSNSLSSVLKKSTRFSYWQRNRLSSKIWIWWQIVFLNSKSLFFNKSSLIRASGFLKDLRLSKKSQHQWYTNFIHRIWYSKECWKVMLAHHRWFGELRYYLDHYFIELLEIMKSLRSTWIKVWMVC